MRRITYKDWSRSPRSDTVTFDSVFAKQMKVLKEWLYLFDLKVVKDARSDGGAERERPWFNSASAAAEMQHSFSIVSIGDHLNSRRQLLYYCVRCKWGFSVDGWSGMVTALGFDFTPLKGREAAQRLETFAAGPCPVFTRLFGRSRITQRVASRESIGRWVWSWLSLAVNCVAKIRMTRDAAHSRGTQIRARQDSHGPNRRRRSL
jgi:hypothetical protein